MFIYKIYMNKTFFLIFILLIIFLSQALPAFQTRWNSALITENYTNLGTGGQYPSSQTDVLLQDSYPITGRNGVSNDQGSKIWWHYPIFEVGSFDQITNNLKFSNNPDTGRCMPADVCGALYKEYQTQSNYVFPQPPVTPESGTRVNYYYSPEQSFVSLPYRADTANILY
jgi:hypothetical protein